MSDFDFILDKIRVCFSVGVLCRIKRTITCGYMKDSDRVNLYKISLDKKERCQNMLILEASTLAWVHSNFHCLHLESDARERIWFIYSY